MYIKRHQQAISLSHLYITKFAPDSGVPVADVERIVKQQMSDHIAEHYVSTYAVKDFQKGGTNVRAMINLPAIQNEKIKRLERELATSADMLNQLFDRYYKLVDEVAFDKATPLLWKVLDKIVP